jgi:hypothetical protein
VDQYEMVCIVLMMLMREHDLTEFTVLQDKYKEVMSTYPEGMLVKVEATAPGELNAKLLNVGQLLSNMSEPLNG